MSNETRVEQRLSAVEQAIADLQDRLAAGDHPAPSNWLDQVIGSITDEAAFREALEFGRAYRMADRPSDNADDRR